MFNIKVVDKYTLYYDESNNMRAFSLRDGRYNIDNDPNQTVTPVFVLGGIALTESQSDLSFEGLRRALNFPQELKFTSISPLRASYGPAKALKCVLGNRRISNILKWLVENHVAIHCFSVNAAYWSALDIIEDLLCFQPEEEELIFQHYYKDCLYRLIKLDKQGFINALNEFGYPKLDKSKARAFLQSLYDLIQKNMGICFSDAGFDEGEGDASRLLKLNYLLYRRLNTESIDLDFTLAYDLHEKILVGDFSTFYCHRIATFPNSKHVLDDESKVEPIINKKFDALKKKGVLDYRFVPSVENYRVQVSDVISGLFRVLLAYLESASLDEVKCFVNEMSAMESTTFKGLKYLLESSIDHCGMFFEAIMPPADIEKYEVLFAKQLSRNSSRLFA